MPLSERLFLIFQKIIPQAMLSRLLGKVAENETVFLKDALIKLFIASYRIPVNEAQEEDLKKYNHFNAFFTRALKAELRPIDANRHAIVSPADGTIAQIGKVEEDRFIQAKKFTYSLLSILGNRKDWANMFNNAPFINIYLAPYNYHRVHMPINGKVLETLYMPGKVFSVNALTTQNIPGLYAQNERLLCLIETEDLGYVMMVLVGALFVAGIETVFSGNIGPSSLPIHHKFATPVSLKKGDEFGRFKYGSTVILFFQQDKVTLSETLHEMGTVLVGQPIGMVN